MANKNSKFIILQGIEQGNVFWSTNNPNEPEEERVKLNDGTVAYRILGYADTEEEAKATWAKHYNNPDLGDLIRMNAANIINNLK